MNADLTAKVCVSPRLAERFSLPAFDAFANGRNSAFVRLADSPRKSDRPRQAEVRVAPLTRDVIEKSYDPCIVPCVHGMSCRKGTRQMSAVAEGKAVLLFEKLKKLDGSQEEKKDLRVSTRKVYENHRNIKELWPRGGRRGAVYLSWVISEKSMVKNAQKKSANEEPPHEGELMISKLLSLNEPEDAAKRRETSGSDDGRGVASHRAELLRRTRNEIDVVNELALLREDADPWRLRCFAMEFEASVNKSCRPELFGVVVSLRRAIVHY